jgi:hypothetical protein
MITTARKSVGRGFEPRPPTAPPPVSQVDGLQEAFKSRLDSARNGSVAAAWQRAVDS